MFITEKEKEKEKESKEKRRRRRATDETRRMQSRESRELEDPGYGQQRKAGGGRRREKEKRRRRRRRKRRRKRRGGGGGGGTGGGDEAEVEVLKGLLGGDNVSPSPTHATSSNEDTDVLCDRQEMVHQLLWQLLHHL